MTVLSSHSDPNSRIRDKNAEITCRSPLGAGMVERTSWYETKPPEHHAAK